MFTLSHLLFLSCDIIVIFFLNVQLNSTLSEKMKFSITVAPDHPTSSVNTDIRQFSITYKGLVL